MLKMIMDHIGKMKIVQAFMYRMVLKRRREKKNKAALLIQRYLRSYNPRKEAKLEIRTYMELRRVKDLELRIRRSSKTDKERMEQAAHKIQRSIYHKIKRRKEGRRLREELKKLPYICRSSYLKMQLLKANTSNLTMEARSQFKYF